MSTNNIKIIPRLTILRGPHDADMAHFVLPYIHKFDVLFLEQLGTAQQKDLLERWANSMTLENSESTGQNWTSDESVGYVQLIRRLENHNVLVRSVDKVYDKIPILDDVISESSVIQLSFRHLEKADLEAMYKSVEENATKNVAGIIKRDKLVATQVVKTIQQLHHDYPDRPLNAVLIQGYDHHSKQHILKLMPDLEITEHEYNSATMKVLRRDPAHKVFEAKLLAPNLPVQHTLIDRALLTNLQYAALAAKKGGAKSSYATATKTLAAPNVKLWLKVVNKTEAMDNARIHVALLTELERYRLKGTDKIVVPAIRLLMHITGKTNENA